MEAATYMISIGAGVFYLIASYRLLQLSRQTGERPEFWLGIYFAAAGQWFVLYNTPFFVGMKALPLLIENSIEWTYAVGVVPYLLFTRCTFRPRAPWATALVGVATLLLVAGATASSLGDGFYAGVDSPSFLMEWIGYTIPPVWICFEGLISHATARKRVRLELCDPVVANRYLLFAGFGFCQIAASAADLFWTYERTEAGGSYAFSVGLLGGTEIGSVAFLWLAFFPPRAYANWIARRAAIPLTTAGT